MELPSALLTPTEWIALRLSLQVALCSALVSLPFAIFAGYLLARFQFLGKWLVEVLIDLPLVLPPVVSGYLLLVSFGPHGPIGSILSGWLGIKIVFTWLGAALASAVVTGIVTTDPLAALPAATPADGGWSPHAAAKAATRRRDAETAGSR